VIELFISSLKNFNSGKYSLAGLSRSSLPSLFSRPSNDAVNALVHEPMANNVFVVTGNCFS
jgi:hypothetical protein